MYPVFRLLYETWAVRRLPPLEPFETHISTHTCWPWDIDLWMELNNGRTLTLYDLNRIPLAIRTGLIKVMKRERWGLTIAGSVVRYRRRVRAFQRVEAHARLLGWDDKFLYIEQSMWSRAGECTSHAVFRSALTDAKGIVAPARIATALAMDAASPPLPEWVSAWSDAEALRPWPPMQG